MRLKFLVLSLLTCPLLTASSRADDSPAPVPVPVSTSAPVQVTAPDQRPTVIMDDVNVYLHLGVVNLVYPIKDGVDVVTLIDLLDHAKPYVGAETPLARTPKGHFVFTAGGITSLQAKGTPFVGGHAVLPNPLPQFSWLNDIDLGGFGSRNFNAGRWMTGVKFSKRFWGPSSS